MKLYYNFISNMFFSVNNNIIKYGYPTNNNLIIFDNYISSYNLEKRIPNWTLHYLEKEDKKVFSKKFNFKNILNSKFIPNKNDYKPYSRGHLVPSGDFNVYDYKENTYVLEANIIPQNKENNEGIWNRLENNVRKYSVMYGELWIITGTIFKPVQKNNIKNINYYVLNDNLAVPNYIYKSILFNNNNKTYMNTYMIPNIDIKHTKFNQFMVNYTVVENLVGYELFDKVDKTQIKHNIVDIT